MSSSAEEHPSGAASDAEGQQRTHASVDEGLPVVDHPSLGEVGGGAFAICDDDELEGNYDSDDEEDDVHGVIDNEVEGLEDGGFNLAERTSQIMSSYQEYVSEIDAESAKGVDVEFGRSNSLPNYHVPFNETTGSAATTGFYRDFSQVDDSDLHRYATSNLHDLPSSTGERGFLGPTRNNRIGFMRSKKFQGLFCSVLVGVAVLVLGMTIPNNKKNDAGENAKTELQQIDESATEDDVDVMAGELGGLGSVVVQNPEGRPVNLLDDQELNGREYGKMLELYQPKFFDRRHWQGNTYADAVIFCATTERMSLCPYEAICPVGARGVPAAFIIVDADQAFAPISTGNAAGEWVQIGSQNGCVKADVGELVQSSEHVACCLPKVAGEQAGGELPEVGEDGSSAIDFGVETLVDSEGNGLSSNENDLSISGDTASSLPENTEENDLTISGDTASLPANVEEQVINVHEQGPYFDVQTKFNPIWFGGSETKDTEMQEMQSPVWVKGSYDDAKDFCSSNFRNDLALELCSFDAICPQGPMNRPYGGIKTSSLAHIWAPISDDHNSWVSVGPEDPCTYYSHLNEEYPHPEFPAEGAQDSYSTQVMCCDASEEALSVVEPLPKESEEPALPGVSPHSMVELVSEIQQKFNPEWFSHADGYPGTASYDDALNFCVRQGGGTLCDLATVCLFSKLPYGGAKDGPNGQKQWSPIGDEYNSWVSDTLEEPCTVNKDASWVDDGSSDDAFDWVLCCQASDSTTTDSKTSQPSTVVDSEPTEEESMESPESPVDLETSEEDMDPRGNVVWFDRDSVSVSTGLSYMEVEDFCLENDLALCSYKVLCPGGLGQPPFGGNPLDGPRGIESYAPVGDSMNEWVSIGSTNTCMRWSNMNGGPPEWDYLGSDETSQYVFNIPCCPEGDVGNESTTTLVKEEGSTDLESTGDEEEDVKTDTALISTVSPASIEATTTLPATVGTPSKPVIDSSGPKPSLWWHDYVANSCVFSSNYTAYMVENDSIDEPWLFVSEAQCCANFICAGSTSQEEVTVPGALPPQGEVTISDTLPPCRWHISTDGRNACTNSGRTDGQTRFFSSSEECCHFQRPLECILEYHGGCIETATTPKPAPSESEPTEPETATTPELAPSESEPTEPETATTTEPATSESEPDEPVTDADQTAAKPSLWWYSPLKGSCIFSPEYTAYMLENNSTEGPYLFGTETQCCGANFLCVNDANETESDIMQVQEKPVYWHHDPLSSSGCTHSSDYPSYMLNFNSTETPYLFDSLDSCCDHNIDNCFNPEKTHAPVPIPVTTTTTSTTTSSTVHAQSKCKWHVSRVNSIYVCTNTGDETGARITFDSAEECCSYRYPAKCTVEYGECTLDNEGDIAESITTPANEEDEAVASQEIDFVSNTLDRVRSSFNAEWFTKEDGWDGKSYYDAIHFCAKQGSRFPCPYEAYCPLGPGDDILGGSREVKNSWAPMIDVPNGWVQVGLEDTCMPYNALHTVPPAWGLYVDDVSADRIDISNVMCCREPEEGHQEWDSDEQQAQVEEETKTSSEVLDIFHPVWYSGRHGYQDGATHDTAELFCKNIGNKQLCPIDAYCSMGSDGNLHLNREPFEGKQWAPLQSNAEGGTAADWVLIGKLEANPTATCSTYDALQGSNPTWDVSGPHAQSEHKQQHVLCCSDPSSGGQGENLEEIAKDLYEPFWFSPVSGWNGGSWSDARSFCGTNGMQICPYTAYCPYGGGQPPMGGHDFNFINTGEQWAPLGDSPDTWVMIGKKYQNTATTCMTSDMLEGHSTSEFDKSKALLLMCCK